ncbi:MULTISPECIES: LytTR family DNA-binding domain-containing protein [Dyadobacter]|uniref:LytTR family DNA-binding domain-containing protein n=1 Tax=Dyadobacter chenhuakuii TaxID=2909339 RepID=A0A9X1TSL3_9BACT|nr:MULTISPECIES: LytTR family DNA-binding domain-containing protein [Dyadobacter]MCF2499224.1 LytTR family DNA-binding domain-containing protein [Dyadobacter chenhuakuii]MCF2517462.1 LytTR family DNA-binding domain-containing protein [Dyadobacter sp. CY351]
MDALIVEDEDLSVRRLRKLLTETAPDLLISGVTDSIEETVEWLRNNQKAGRADPDLIFLDIELSDGQSFEIFNRVQVTSTIIFTTSYDEYALQAFKLNSIDYLLKPVHRDDLQRSLQKYENMRALPAEDSLEGIKKLLEGFQKTSKKEYRQRFLVKQGQKMLSIEVSEIAYFFTEERYSFFVTDNNQKLLVDYTLDELADVLDPARFFRINRGMMVTHKAVDKIDPYFGSRLALSLRPSHNKEALVSREKVGDFKHWMGK